MRKDDDDGRLKCWMPKDAREKARGYKFKAWARAAQVNWLVVVIGYIPMGGLSSQADELVAVEMAANIRTR